MYTTIMISNELKKELSSLKLYPNETYENVISDLIEDRKLLTKEFLKELDDRRKDFDNGKYVTLEELKKKAEIIWHMRSCSNQKQKKNS